MPNTFREPTFSRAALNTFLALSLLLAAVGVTTFATPAHAAGIDWTPRDAAEANVWTSVAYGNEVWVAVSATGTNRVMRSTNGGQTWEAVDAAAANQWYSVAYGDGVWIAVSIDGTNRVMRSTNGGQTWEAVAAAAANQWRSVAYGNGVWVAVSSDNAVGTDANSRVMRSTNGGQTWEAVAAAEPNQWVSVAYGNDTWIATAVTGTKRVMRSTNGGETWEAVDAAAANQWRSVAYGNGAWIAVSSDNAVGTDANSRVMRSTNGGQTWSAIPASAANSWYSVAYGDGVWVAVAYFTGQVMRSTDDGVTWASASSGVNQQWGSVAYGDGVWVVVAATGNNIPRARTSTAPVLAVGTQPSETATNGETLPRQPIVQLRDPAGDVAREGVTVTAEISSGDGVLTGTLTATTGADGAATFAGLTITGVAGDYQLTFSATGLTSVASDGITVSAGTASQLAVVLQPSATATSGAALNTQPTVRLADVAGNLVNEANVAVTAAIATGDGDLDGTLTVTTDADGVATFDDLTITGAAGAYQLTFSATGLTAVTSETIDVTVNTVAQRLAAKMALALEPSPHATSSEEFTQQPTVQLQDMSANPVNEAGVVITAAISTGDGVLDGNVTAITDATGRATFENLAITGATGSYRIVFRAVGLPSVTSETIQVTARAGADGVALACTPFAIQAGSTVTCAVSGGTPDAELSWRAAFNPVFAQGIVALTSDGTGSFSFVVPQRALGQVVTVELVDQAAPVPLGVVGALVPSSVPAGEGTAHWWPPILVVMMALLFILQRSPSRIGRRTIG